MKMIFKNVESSRTSERHKFVLSFIKRLDLESLNKHVAIQNLPIYYTWKNISKY